MINLDSIMSISKSNIQEASKALSNNDIQQLVEWLSVKDDNIRYQAFLILQSRSIFFYGEGFGWRSEKSGKAVKQPAMRLPS